MLPVGYIIRFDAAMTLAGVISNSLGPAGRWCYSFEGREQRASGSFELCPELGQRWLTALRRGADTPAHRSLLDESYFVRTWVHRSDSAFMHMLQDQDNGGYQVS